MPWIAFALGGVAFVGLVAWLVVGQRRKRQAAEAALEQLGFHPCPDKKAWLDETVTNLEGHQRFQFEVRDPRRFDSQPAIYLYTKTRRDADDEKAMEQEELLFPLKRPSANGVALIVKPSSLKAGLATKIIELVATGPWQPQADDMKKIELPADLLESNVMVALGPRAGLLYDLIDTRTVGVLKMLGDCGVMMIQCRDGWCSLGSAGAQTPFDVAEIVSRIRPLLR